MATSSEKEKLARSLTSAENEQPARVQIIVSGFVQGVGYRYHCQRMALRHHLSGYAQNLWDGKVKVIAEGDRQKLLTFVEQIKKGPRMSQISHTETFWEPYEGVFKDFEVR